MKYILSLLFISIPYLVFSQDKSIDSASCVAYWKKGETKVYSIRHLKESYKQGKQTSKTNFSYNAEVVVLDSTASSYKIQWTYRLPESAKRENPSLAEVAPLYEGLKMVFTTTETGAFVELLNWREVRDAYVKMLKLSFPKNMDSAGRVALDKTIELFNSREMVESSIIKEIQILHFPYGYQFSTNEIKADGEISIPFADEPLPTIQTFKITDINPEEDYFKLVIEQDINLEGAAAIFEGMLKRMNVARDTIPSKAKEMLSSFEIKDHSEYRFEQSTGWIKRLLFRRTSKSDDLNQIESYLIELVES